MTISLSPPKRKNPLPAKAGSRLALNNGREKRKNFGVFAEFGVFAVREIKNSRREKGIAALEFSEEKIVS